MQQLAEFHPLSQVLGSSDASMQSFHSRSRYLPKCLETQEM